MAKIIGNHIYFLRKGLSVDSVTVAKDAKPDHDPVANWTANELPCVSGISPSVNTQKEASYCPNANGVYVKADEIVTETEVAFTATFEELNLLTYELLFGSGQLTAAAQAQILSGTAEVEGWVWLKQQDNSGNTILDAEFWAKATISQVNFERAITRPQISFAMVDAGALGVVTASNV